MLSREDFSTAGSEFHQLRSRCNERIAWLYRSIFLWTSENSAQDMIAAEKVVTMTTNIAAPYRDKTAALTAQI